MDIDAAIEYLKQQRSRIDRSIAALQQLDRSLLGGIVPISPAAKPFFEPQKRRGRKFMSEMERKAVSERMKAYWAISRSVKTLRAGGFH